MGSLERHTSAVFVIPDAIQSMQYATNTLYERHERDEERSEEIKIIEVMSAQVQLLR